MLESELTMKADPELLRQLNAASSSHEPIVAVVRLRSDDPSQIVPPPEETEGIVQNLLKRVKDRVGTNEARYNVFKNLGYFVVAADKSFLRELISQPEVAKVVANKQPDSALIPPVRKRPVPPLPRKKASGAAKKAKTHTAARKAAGKSSK